MGIRADIGILNRILVLIESIVFLKNFVKMLFIKFRSLLIASTLIDGGGGD